MQLRHFATAGFAIIPAMWIGCNEEPNGCEDAKISIEKQIKDMCEGENKDPAYAGSPFCTCCVANQFYSIDNNCTCRALLFDTDSCYYATDLQAKPQVRSAIEYANSICVGRLVTVPYLDASTAQCTSDPASGAGGMTTSSMSSTSSTSSSSSTASGTGGAGGAG